MSFEIIRRNVWRHSQTGETRSAFEPPTWRELKDARGDPWNAQPWQLVTDGYTVRWTDQRTGAASYGLPEPHQNVTDLKSVTQLARKYDAEGYPGIMYSGRAIELEEETTKAGKAKR